MKGLIDAHGGMSGQKQPKERKRQKKHNDGGDKLMMISLLTHSFFSVGYRSQETPRQELQPYFPQV